jgi:multiple sugar transport system permease protein
VTTVTVERPTTPAVSPSHRPHRARMTRRRTKRALRYAVIVIVCIVALFPIYWMFLSAVQPSQYELTWPPSLFFRGFEWSSFTSLFDTNPIAKWLLHSATASLVCVGITLVFAIPGAYLLSRLRWRGVSAFGFLLLFTQLMPGAMILVPELQLFRRLNLTENLYALGVLYAAFNIPLGCWILKSSFDTVPKDIIDASLVDGAGKIRALTRILLPISLPGVVAVAIVAFFGSWNDYIFASAFITNNNNYTAGLGLATFITDQVVHVNQLEAAGVVFSALPILLYVLVQRHVVRGLTAGAVK